MIVNVVLFDRGSGGNFLARVLTLDPSTVCLGPYSADCAEDRCELYCYPPNTVAPGTPAGNGLSVWVDKELNNFYFPFSRGIEKLIELDKTVLEFIHPDHYHSKIQLLGKNDQVFHYYIDTENCHQWVMSQIKHKILKPHRIYSNTMLNTISAETDAHPISLKNIIESEQTFVVEYERICRLMQLDSFSPLAAKIYRSWKKTWAPQ